MVALTLTAAGTVLLFFMPECRCALAQQMIAGDDHGSTTGSMTPQHVKRLWRVFLGVLALTVLADLS